MASIPRQELTTEEFKEYSPFEFTRQVTEIQDAEFQKALGHWHSALEDICSRLQEIFPANGRSKTGDEYDIEFVKGKYLQQALVAGLGHDYLAAQNWLASLQNNVPTIMDAFKISHGEELKTFEQTLSDACDLSATILAYNVIIHAFPNKSPAERRQAWKDLRKKLKHKFGNKYDMPSAVSDRLQSAVSAK